MAVALLAAVVPADLPAKSYSSGGGRSYSSSRGSSSGSRSSGFSSGSGKSYRSSSGSSSSSSRGSGSSLFGGGSGSSSGSSSGKSFSSSRGRSYSSGSSSRGGYSSHKSYSSSSSGRSGGRSFFSSSSPSDTSLDTGAARAMKESASKRDFESYKKSQATAGRAPASDYSGAVPPVIPPSQRAGGASAGGNNGGYSRSYRPSTIWHPDYVTYSTRPYRLRTFFGGYYTRPIVVYHDPYNSFFWWWLLDQSLESRAYWAYHHRYDMDDARYQDLLNHDAQLEARIHQLEQDHVPVDPNYVPAGVDRDLMYTDNYVHRAYANRPTYLGRILFALIMVPATIGAGAFFIWLVFFKRWQVRTA